MGPAVLDAPAGRAEVVERTGVTEPEPLEERGHERFRGGPVPPADQHAAAAEWLDQQSPARSGRGAHWVTRCQENGPNDVVVVASFLGFTVRRRYSNGMVLPCTTIRWKFGTSYDGWLCQAS